MDSIFEQPRTTPKPTPVTQNFRAPVVPEASLIMQSVPKDPKINGRVVPVIPPHKESYNAWKLRNAPNLVSSQDSFVGSKTKTSTDKENLNKLCQNYANFQYAYNSNRVSPPQESTNASILKKQVRFERPFHKPIATVMVESPKFSDLFKSPKEPVKEKYDKDEKIDVPPIFKQYVAPLNKNPYNVLPNKIQDLDTRPKHRTETQITSNPSVTNEKKFVNPYEKIYTTHTNTNLDLSFQEIGPESCGNELFEKSTLNSDGIRKFALPEHILQQERNKIRNIQPEINGNIFITQDRMQSEEKFISTNMQTLRENQSKQITSPEINGNVIMPNRMKSEDKFVSINTRNNPENQMKRYTRSEINEFMQNRVQSDDKFVSTTSQNLPENKTKQNYVQTIDLTQNKLPMENYPNAKNTKENMQNYTNVQNTKESTQDAQNILIDLTNKETMEDKGKKKCTCNCQLSNDDENKENQETNDKEREKKTDPTVVELLNIVKQQNEQLHILQNQVEMLIKMNETNKKQEIKESIANIIKLKTDTENLKDFQNPKSQIMVPKKHQKKLEDKPANHRERKLKKNVVLYKDEQVGTSYNEGICKRVTQENFITKETDKISVGIMTSFQVSLKTPFENLKLQKNYYDPEKNSFEHKKQHQKKYYESESSSSTLSEEEECYSNKNRRKSIKPITVFTETFHDKNKRLLEEKLRNEITNDNGRDDNDYSLEDIALEEPVKVREPPLSPNNTVHVEMQDYESDSSDDESSSIEPWTFYDNILGKVNHLLGNSPEQRDSNRGRHNHQMKQSMDQTLNIIKEAAIQNLKQQKFTPNSKEFDDLKPNEISFAVKQLLMKYMSDEDLASVVQERGARRSPVIISSEESSGSTRKKDYIRSVPNGYVAPKKQMKSSLKKGPPSVLQNGNKILDITALKQQPKFL